MNFKVLLILVATVAGISGLDDLRRYAGPPCSSIRGMVPADADRAALDRLRYVVAGGRYTLYQVAAQQPSYPTMTEAELLETICWSRNASSTEITRPSGIFTFGQYNPRMYTTRPGVYLSSPLTPNGRGMTFDNIVTLTDQKTFAISVNCWRGPGVDASSYMILSQTSQLQDPGTWRRINGHLANLGFRPNDLLVLRNENCSWRKNPALEEWTKVRSGPRSRYPESAVPPRQQRVPIGNYNQGSRFGKGSWQG